jgi:AcrR family transcriptional regulator
MGPGDAPRHEAHDPTCGGGHDHAMRVVDKPLLDDEPAGGLRGVRTHDVARVGRMAVAAQSQPEPDKSAGNMSIYHYVKDRDELLALVLDETLGTVSLRKLPDEPIEALRVLSTRFVTAFARHPETIPLFVLRPVLSIGPHGAALFDRFVGLLRDLDLSDDTVADTTVALIEYLCGHLVGHLPQVRGAHTGNGDIVDEVLASMADGAAPNIRAIAPALRRAAEDVSPAAGIDLILSGLAARSL